MTSSAPPLTLRLRALLFGALATLAALAGSGAQAAQRPLGAAVDVVLAPAGSGESLVAGGRAVLGWTSAGPLPGIEEWEAFLSYDGGATWPVRLTPHLGIDLRRFEVELPPIATANARLLLRFGDEHEEREIEVPRSFAIGASRLEPAATPELAAARGEAARPGLAGVVWWIDGDRDGGRRARHEASPRGLAPGAPAFRDGDAAAAAGDGESAPRLPLRAESQTTFDLSGHSAPPVPALALAATTGRRLALLSRRNE